MLLLNTSRIRGGTYSKYNDIQYTTVDKVISKTKILLRIIHYCTEKCDLHFNLRLMILVHVSALFKQTSHYGGNQYRTHFKRLFITRSIRKNVDVQLYAKNTLDWRKIKMVNAPLRIQQIIHLIASIAPSSLPGSANLRTSWKKTYNNRKTGKQTKYRG